MAAPWQRCLARCHGLHAVLVDSPLALPVAERCRIPHRHVLAAAPRAVPAGKSLVVADALQWPVRPGSIDLVVLPLAGMHLPALESLLHEIDGALGPDAWLVVAARKDTLAAWCRDGMALCQAHGLVLREAHWGDERRFNLMPPRLSRMWSARWQNWLPGAEWSVQLWQKDTLCPVSRAPSRARRRQGDWSGAAWAPQSRAGNAHIKDSA